jgi:hypothetical protein
MLGRFDFFFSYWIFVWYVFYELRLISYNPQGALMFALLLNVVLLPFMLYDSYSYTICFFIIIFLFKIIPLWRLKNTMYTKKDVYASIILFMIYMVWILVNKVNIFSITLLQIDNIKKNKPIGPMMYLFCK